ncbi:MAG: hypothetical protein [Microvirus sp.]|nr:MAG: hypothetical protein [Microvirus sp.]
MTTPTQEFKELLDISLANRHIIYNALFTHLQSVKRLQKKYTPDSILYHHHTNLIKSINHLMEQLNVN